MALAALLLLMTARNSAADGVLLVDGGPFVMGSDRDGQAEAPQHGLASDRRATGVVRGASHDDGPEALRVTIRRSYEHSGTARGHHHVGFRCVRSETR